MSHDPDEIEWMDQCNDCLGSGYCSLCDRECLTCDSTGEVPRRE